MSEQREPGWYWVRFKHREAVVEWDGKFWRAAGYSAMNDSALGWIGPRINHPNDVSKEAEVSEDEIVRVHHDVISAYAKKKDNLSVREIIEVVLRCKTR